MTRNSETMIFNDRKVLLNGRANADWLLVQPVDGHDITELDAELDYLDAHAGDAYLHVAYPVARWNEELTPWPAPPVIGKTPFGDGAGMTLEHLKSLIGRITDSKQGARVVIGGYSLAGLFALWASCQTDFFAATVAASPSLWFDGWLDYAAQHPMMSQAVYLSLGDKETHSKNKTLATIAQCMERQADIVSKQQVRCVMEWNAGNHFQDNGLRMGKGFAWVMNHLIDGRE